MISDIFGDAGRRLQILMYRLGGFRFLLLPFLVVLALFAATFNDDDVEG